MIPFFKKTTLNHLDKSSYLTEGNFRKNVTDFFIENFKYPNFYLTKSCTQSLEIALLTLNPVKNGEVILPSYGFVSIANAVALRGFKCVFVDCEPETMNIDTNAAIQAINQNTIAIICINYAGIACNYDALTAICKEKNITLIEDNAHGIKAKYKDRYLGSIGDISTISFDFLKNISCDEGGGIAINNRKLEESFEKIYHFGTNKLSFLRGESEFYEWKSLGTNAILAEPLSEILFQQLQNSDEIISKFLEKWHYYYSNLSDLVSEGHIQLAQIPEYSTPNGHMFWIKTKNSQERKRLIDFLAERQIQTAFHYTPLHSSEFGKKAGNFFGEDIYTTQESQKLLRLPIYYSLEENQIDEVIASIRDFYTL